MRQQRKQARVGEELLARGRVRVRVSGEGQWSVGRVWARVRVGVGLGLEWGRSSSKGETTPARRSSTKHEVRISYLWGTVLGGKA